MEEKINEKNIEILKQKPIFIFFTYDGVGLPVAYRLIEEGYKVYVGQFYHLEKFKEDEKEKEQRLSLYDGLIDKKSGVELLNSLSKIKNKDRYFVIFDFSFMCDYAEEVKKMGFRGLLPSKEDWEFENNREMAQEFAEENYEIFSEKEHIKFEKIEEAEEFLQNTDKIWVIKGNHPNAPTYVPISDDVEIAKKEILSIMKEYKSEYEKEGFSLQEKIIDILEITPEAISYNKKVCGINIDLELKNFAPGDMGFGFKTGCSADTVFWLKKEEAQDLYDKFLRPLEKKVLRENEMTIWDASVLYDKKTKNFYFGEYCFDRPGYNSWLTELSTLPYVGYYFEKLLNEEYLYNPKEVYRFGASVRVFRNVEFGKSRDKIKSESIILPDGFDKNVWLWDVKKTSKGLETANYDINVACITGQGDTLEEAFENAFKNLKKIVFEGYHWQLESIFSKSYKNNIPERFEFVKSYFGFDDIKFSNKPKIEINITTNLEPLNEEVKILNEILEKIKKI